MISIAKIKLGLVYGANLGSKIAIKIEKKKRFFWDILEFSSKYMKKMKKSLKVFTKFLEENQVSVSIFSVIF